LSGSEEWVFLMEVAEKSGEAIAEDFSAMRGWPQAREVVLDSGGSFGVEDEFECSSVDGVDGLRDGGS
jgi:hypothetical protein